MPTNEVENADSKILEEIREAQKAADELENDDEEIFGHAEGNDNNEESEMLKLERDGDCYFYQGDPPAPSTQKLLKRSKFVLLLKVTLERNKMDYDVSLASMPMLHQVFEDRMIGILSCALRTYA